MLHTVHAYPPSVGGSEAVVERLSEGLAKRGHRVEVATRTHPNREPNGGVRVHEFPGGPLGWRQYRQFVHQGLDEERWDVVMTYHSKVWTHLALAPFTKGADRWVYCPTEFTDLNSWKPRHKAYYATMEPSSLRKAARVVVLTQRDRERALDIAGSDIEDRVSVIPNGVDVEWWRNGDAGMARKRFNLPQEAPIVLHVGGLWDHKDVATLVDAIARVREAHLVLAGDPRGNANQVQRRARHGGCAHRVHVLGEVERDALRSLYHAADVLASASTNEGFGLTFLEGMACGLPLVARRVGVIPELVERDAAVAVAESVNAFASGISNAIKEGGGDNAAIAEAYDWEAIVDRFEALYAEVAAEALV